ncbi:MAG: hypothetical protein E3K36_11675 [Candidatus Brocadia sp.]|nr:hypothetical protein [Candidatus Brocadia sp.]
MEINVESFTATGETRPTLRDVKQGISMRNLEFNARTFPDIQQIQNFANGVQKLEKLALHPDLKKIQ